jgi:hypothetical protein
MEFKYKKRAFFFMTPKAHPKNCVDGTNHWPKNKLPVSLSAPALNLYLQNLHFKPIEITVY